MSFPNQIYGSYGDERAAQSTKIGDLPLGTRMILPDGRIFAHAQAGGTTLAVAKLIQTMNTVDDHDTARFAGEASAIGDTTVVLTMGATSVVTKDQYADGYLYTTSGTGQGYIHRVKSNNSAASTGVDCTFTLEDGDGIQVALLADTSYCGLRVNPFKSVVVFAAGTIIGQVLGIPPVAVTNAYYFWCQTRGPAMCIVDGNHTLGLPVHASSAVSGAVAPFAASSAQAWYHTKSIGWTLAVCASTQYGPIFLDLE